jgi:hypothetical protein
MFQALFWLHKTTLALVATHDAFLGGEEAQRARCECTFPLGGINLVQCLVNLQV